MILGSRYLFSALAAQLLEYLASRELAFGQLTSLLRACCPTPHLIGFPRTWFWAANISSPRLLPNFSSIWLPANLVLGSQYLFSALAAQLLEYLASRELSFGQPAPLLRACCPISRVFGFPRTWFWAANISSPRLLPNFSFYWLPADLVLGSQHLFSALAAQLLFLLASRGLGFGQPVPLLRACCPNILPADHCRTGLGTFKTQNRGDQPTSPPPPNEKEPIRALFRK